MSIAARPPLRALARHRYLAMRRALSGVLVDRRRGIETSRDVDLEPLGVAGEHRVRYEPSGWLDLRRALRGEAIGPDDVFIDFGSGKGRVVLDAARFPFKRVIGVELSPQLTAVAQANLAASRGRLRCPDVELITADAARFRVPDDVTVAYIYNAFRGPVFQAVIEELIRSVDRNPRTLRLIYRTALEHERLIATGRYKLARVTPGLRPSVAWSRKMATRHYLLEPSRHRAEERVTAA